MAVNLAINDRDTANQFTSIGESIFNTDFPFLDNAEIRVSVDQVDQVLGVDFNLSGLGAAGGFTVTFTSATTIGELITIWQDMPFVRLTGFSTGAAVLAGEALNTEFVRQIRHDQQIRRDIRAALRLAPDDPQAAVDMELPTKATRAGKALAFDANGKPTVLSLVSSEDASLRADLASIAASFGFNLVAITKTAAESTAGATIVNAHLPVCNVYRYQNNAVEGVTDMTAGIQMAHDVSKSGNFETVVFPGGNYLFTTLTWSPYVRAITSGKVFLRTANASGRTIQVSDEYGLPVLLGKNTARNFVFDGQFYLDNTNGANTAKAWSFGGATSANNCNLCTPLRGVETRNFHGAFYEYRFNSFLVDLVDCFSHGGNGAHIQYDVVASNSGENNRFINTVFGHNKLTGSGHLIDINVANFVSLGFFGCSCDYMLGMNKPGNTAPLLTVYWSGGHLEWDTVADAYLQNDSTSTWIIDGATIFVGAAAGWPSPAVSETTGAGTTKFINIKYVLPAGLNILHDAVSSTSVLVLDYEPNYQGGSTPIQFVQFDAAAEVGLVGVKHRELAFTPVWSGTLGNGTIIGTYQIIGNVVTCWIKLTWGLTTSHGAVAQTFGLPVIASALHGGGGSWYANDFGTAARSGTVRVAPAGSAMTLYNAPTSTIITDLVPHTWANQDSIEITAILFI